MTAGYYDYAPTVTLARPVALTGSPGSAFREVGYELAALTGLPVHDLDRRIEHEAGQTLWHLARRQGLDALHEQERRWLPAVLDSTPPGIVILGEGVLLDPDQLRATRQRAALVFLRLPAQACYWSLRQRTEARDGILGHPWLPDRLDDVDDLRPMLGLQRPVIDAADRVVDMEGGGARRTVLDLQAALPALGIDPN